MRRTTLATAPRRQPKFSTGTSSHGRSRKKGRKTVVVVAVVVGVVSYRQRVVVLQPNSRYGGFEKQENHRFHQLLCSKYFLLTFIRTLEARQREFSAQDKSVTHCYSN